MQSSTSNSDSTAQKNTFQSSLTTICHWCNKDIKEFVKCQKQECDLVYCRNCLVRKYKFSKKAAKKLPGATWKCPRCIQSCFCTK